VVCAHVYGLNELLELPVGAPKHLVWGEDLAGLGHGQVGLANVQATRPNGGGDIGMVVDDKQGSVALAQVLEGCRQGQRFSLVPELVTQLEHARAAIDSSHGDVEWVSSAGYLGVDDHVETTHLVSFSLADGTTHLC
jgi:hypothetical protein